MAKSKLRGVLGSQKRTSGELRGRSWVNLGGLWAGLGGLGEGPGDILVSKNFHSFPGSRNNEIPPIFFFDSSWDETAFQHFFDIFL